MLLFYYICFINLKINFYSLFFLMTFSFFLVYLFSLLMSRADTIRNDALQDQIDTMAQKYTQEFQSDSTSILIYNYTNGQVKYLTQSPFITWWLYVDFRFLINPFIYALALDNKTIILDDKYSSLTPAETFPYDIKNVDAKCKDINTFDQSMIFGCNFWSIRAFLSLWNSPISAYTVFVEKMKFFWFAIGYNEISSWDILPIAMWLDKETSLFTLAVAYGALINGGKYIEPTFDGMWRMLQVISPQTSRTMKSMLLRIVAENSVFDYMKKYWNHIWWYSVSSPTKSIFIWFVENKDYIIVVSIKNPKVKIKNTGLAGVIFGEVVKQIDTF